MLGGGKLKQFQEARQMLQNPRESEQIRGWAEILAKREAANREAVREVYDALGLGEEAPQPVDAEERINGLCDVLAAYVGEEDIRAVYLRHWGPEDVQNVDTALNYMGMGQDDWRAQCERWAESYRERGAEGDTLELAQAHVENTWAVSLAAFETHVVEMDASDAALRMVDGHGDETEQALRALPDLLGGESA